MCRFFEGKAFGKLAETLSGRLHKGSKVMLEGRLNLNRREHAGQQQSNFEVIIRKIEVLHGIQPHASYLDFLRNLEIALKRSTSYLFDDDEFESMFTHILADDEPFPENDIRFILDYFDLLGWHQITAGQLFDVSNILRKLGVKIMSDGTMKELQGGA